MFTLIVPVFNGADTLPETLRSLIAQSIRGIRIIVLDNGSTDGTESIVRSFNDTRIHYRRYEHTTSLGESLNRAFDIEIQSQFFSICHADDIYHYDYVKIMAESFEKHEDADILFCPAELIDSSGERIVSVYNGIKKFYSSLWPRYNGSIGASRLLVWNNLIAPSAAFRTSALKSLPRFSSDLTYLTDLYFWIGYLLRGGVIRVLETPLIFYRVHSAQMSSEARKLDNQFREFDLLYKILREKKFPIPAFFKLFVYCAKYARYVFKPFR